MLLGKLTKRSVDVRFLDSRRKIEKIGGDKVSAGAGEDRHRRRQRARRSRRAQGSKLKVQGAYPGRHRARHRHQARRPAGGDRAAAQGGRRPAADVQQLPRLSAARTALLLGARAGAAAAPRRGAERGAGRPDGHEGAARHRRPDADARGRRERARRAAAARWTATARVVERGGAQTVLRVGAAPVRLAAARAAPAAREIVISAGPGGHFVAAGAINGRAGAVHRRHRRHPASRSAASEAERIGLD